MAEAFVYDAVRTPRGRGKKDGSLHEVPAVRLAARVLGALRDRNGLDTGTVDDIIFGCVDPVGEAGAVIPRAAAFEAGYATTAPACRSRVSAPPASTPSTLAPPRSRKAQTT
jgi:acetyl-CoA C-acetyltransferase